MARVKPTHVSGVFLISEHPVQLARFYEKALCFPLGYDHADRVNGEDNAPHFECDFGSVHFAIHPPRDGSNHPRSNNAMYFSINVESLDEYMVHIQKQGIEPEFGPLDLDFGRLAGITDPEGNTVLLTEVK